MTPPFDSSLLSSADKDALIATLLTRIEELSKRLGTLEAENAALRAKLNLPPKTPDNSSTPPSQPTARTATATATVANRTTATAPVLDGERFIATTGIAFAPWTFGLKIGRATPSIHNGKR